MCLNHLEIRYKSIGCWKEQVWERAVTKLKLDAGEPWDLMNITKSCAHAAKRRGFTVFAISPSARGPTLVCSSSRDAAETYNRYGSAEWTTGTCRNNKVYTIIPQG